MLKQLINAENVPILNTTQTEQNFVDWLPSSNTYLVKHAYFYIAFNLLMAEFEFHGYVLSIGRGKLLQEKIG